MVSQKSDQEDVLAYPFTPSMSSSVKAMKDTWTQRCQHTIYFADAPQDDVDAIQLQHNIGTWSATREAIKHVQKLSLDFEWILFAETDTYVIMDNLNFYLTYHNSTDPHYLGHAYSAWAINYNAAGPGFVLSRAAFSKVHQQLLKGKCGKSATSEDTALGKCLVDVGVNVLDTRDHELRGRFLMFMPESLLVPGNLPWSESFWRESKYLSPEVS